VELHPSVLLRAVPSHLVCGAFAENNLRARPVRPEGVENVQSLSLKFCAKNLPKSEKALEAIRQKYPDLNVEVADCLDVCGLCFDVPFALRNNAIVGARNDRELFLKLEKGMEPLLRQTPLPGTAAANARLAAAQETASQTKSAVQTE
jgi:uncharacterized protein YuzB (UPF0349 family)